MFLYVLCSESMCVLYIVCIYVLEAELEALVCLHREVNIHEFSNRFQPGSELHRLFQQSAVS